jgi:cell division protein FtsQ
MSRLRRFLRPLGFALGTVGALIILGFVDRSTALTPIAELKVAVLGGEGLHFIDEESVRRTLAEQGGVIGAAAGQVDLAGLERRLRAIPCVADAETYHDLHGVLHVSVRQREPVIRVFNADGSSFYIDADGFTMPVQERYTARVPVAMGWLNEPGTAHGVINVHAHDTLTGRCRSDELHRLAMFLRQDELWSALIDQVVVAADGQMELVPTVGRQRILIGDGSSLEQRFAKLKLFYKHGIPKADWRRYSRIDLRFSEQIVCTKRTNPNEP